MLIARKWFACSSNVQCSTERWQLKCMTSTWFGFFSFHKTIHKTHETRLLFHFMVRSILTFFILCLSLPPWVNCYALLWGCFWTFSSKMKKTQKEKKRKKLHHEIRFSECFFRCEITINWIETVHVVFLLVEMILPRNDVNTPISTSHNCV